MSNDKELEPEQLLSVRGGINPRSILRLGGLGGKIWGSMKKSPMGWLIGGSVAFEVAQPVANWALTPTPTPGCKLGGDEVPAKFSSKWICEPGTVQAIESPAKSHPM